MKSAANAPTVELIDTRTGELEHAVRLIYRVCCLAGHMDFVAEAKADLEHHGVYAAVANHDTPVIFDWLVSTMSYQGISNRVATAYMERHGRVTWHDIASGLAPIPSCPKLASYWHYHGCGFHKGSGTCAEPDHLPICPLPRHRLRNGRLNQAAYSLFLFIRDVAAGDLVAWIDTRLAQADEPWAVDRTARLREGLLGPLRHVYGVSDKVLSMSLATLLLGAGHGRAGWLEAGGAMIVIDTLVHNFFHRTGILHRLHGSHAYGPGCYGPGGCAEVVEEVAAHIDAREFNRRYPAAFPRFIAHAIWRFCAQDGLNVCNGIRIAKSCENSYCQLQRICNRIVLLS